MYLYNIDYWYLSDPIGIYPLVLNNIAIENGSLIVDLPNLKTVSFNSYAYQRVMRTKNQESGL